MLIERLHGPLVQLVSKAFEIQQAASGAAKHTSWMTVPEDERPEPMHHLLGDDPAATGDYLRGRLSERVVELMALQGPLLLEPGTEGIVKAIWRVYRAFGNYAVELPRRDAERDQANIGAILDAGPPLVAVVQEYWRLLHGRVTTDTSVIPLELSANAVMPLPSDPGITLFQAGWEAGEESER
jgi:hypothetical protein